MRNIKFRTVRITTVVILFFTSVLSGCKKYLEVPLPIDQLATETVYSNSTTISAAVNGMYSIFGAGLTKANYYRVTHWLSDEGYFPAVPGGDQGALVSANIAASNTNIPPWSWFFPSVYRANDIISHLENLPPNILSDSLRKQYIAAAKYVRAAEHLTLVSTWGDVPYITSISAEENLVKTRTPAAQVYDAIIKDLQEAAAALPATVISSSSVYIHNKYQPLALLAKAYLYSGKWVSADSAASAVIAGNQYQLVTGVNNVFKRGSKEAIFSQGSAGSGLLYDNRAFIGLVLLPTSAAGAATYSSLSPAMMNNFEAADQRKVSGNWVLNKFSLNLPNKYWYDGTATAATIAANPQDFIYQRLAELYLIRAEARAQQDNFTGAVSDINAIRTRAGLGNTTAFDKPTIMAAIEKERICELFYEGHRWYDLKRWGKLDAVLGALSYKAANWKPYYNLWPIQQTDLNSAPLLIQNPGY